MEIVDERGAKEIIHHIINIVYNCKYPPWNSSNVILPLPSLPYMFINSDMVESSKNMPRFPMKSYSSDVVM